MSPCPTIDVAQSTAAKLCPPKAEVVSSNLAGSARSSAFSHLFYCLFWRRFGVAPIWAPIRAPPWGSGLGCVGKGPFQHCIIQRLASLWAACERAIDDDPAALSTSIYKPSFVLTPEPWWARPSRSWFLRMPCARRRCRAERRWRCACLPALDSRDARCR